MGVPTPQCLKTQPSNAIERLDGRRSWVDARARRALLESLRRGRRQRYVIVAIETPRPERETTAGHARHASSLKITVSHFRQSSLCCLTCSPHFS